MPQSYVQFRVPLRLICTRMQRLCFLCYQVKGLATTKIMKLLLEASLKTQTDLQDLRKEAKTLISESAAQNAQVFIPLIWACERSAEVEEAVALLQYLREAGKQQCPSMHRLKLTFSTQHSALSHVLRTAQMQQGVQGESITDNMGEVL